MGLHRIYKASSPYPQSAVLDVDYAQTADVLRTVHLDYAPRKCIRYGHTDWRWETITFGPDIDPPVGSSVSATSPNNTGYVAQTYNYRVTAIKDSAPVQESRASATISVSNDLSLSGNYNTITVPAPSGDVTRHVIYKEQGGIYGYIGATEGTTFRDIQYQPILSETPPTGENPFASAGNYPAAVTHHQQRTFFGATRNIINGVWATRSADPENMDKSRPARADDSIALALVAEKVNGVTHLLSLEELLLFTTDAVWAITGDAKGTITPAETNPKRMSMRGARHIKPLPVDTYAFFVPSKGQQVRALGFSFEIEGYKSDNVSIFSPHMFQGYSLIKLVYQEEPFSVIWAVRSDGVLLALTWEIEQQVWGWSRIETNGSVEDVAVISEGGYDRLYALIRRTIAGVERLCVERMALPHASDMVTANHLDCSVTQVFDPPQNRIEGLWHLEGETVSVTYDGYASHGLVVEDGAIEIPNGVEATLVTVGLPYSGRIETLPAALTSGEGSVHVNRQQIGDVVVRTIDTRGIEIGVSGVDFLEPVQPHDGSDVNEQMDVDARDYRIPAPGDWKDTSTVIIEQNEPLPAHIVGIFHSMLVART